MSERSAKVRAPCVRQAARCAAAAGALVLVLSAQPTAQAQTYPPVVQRYLSNGADMTTVPKPGEPGYQWFSSGADATTLPNAGQPGGEWFSSGADATSTRSNSLAEAYSSRGAEVTTAQPGTPAGEYFSRGAETTSAKPGTVAGQYFSQGAALTSVPKPGQFGAEYFSQGADATNVSRWFEMPVLQTPATPEQAAGEAQLPSGVESAPEKALPSEEPVAEEEGAVEQGAAGNVEGQGAGKEQASTLTTGQVRPSPGAGRAIETPAAATSSQVTRPAPPPTPTPGRARSMLDVLASYTLASTLVLIAAPLLALLVALGGRAYARRHA